MARVKVGYEAQEEYLISRNIEKREKLAKSSDDELCEFYCKAVKENGLEEDAKQFTKKWCMDFK